MDNYSSSEPFGISDSSGSKPPKAYRNADFLNSTAARHIRVQCELLEPYYRFKNQSVNNSIVFFGSARIQPIATIEEKLETLEKEGGDSDLSEEKAFLEGQLKVSRYYEDARELSKQLTQWSQEAHEPKDRYYVCSGGGPGIMEAANRGAHEAGGRSIGLGISLPFEASNNAYIPQELNFEFHYFFVRKYWFLYPAKAIVVFPGGFGTMDELFEVLTLIQTQKITKKLPIILYGSDFWNDLIDFDKFKKWGVISPEDTDLFSIIGDVTEAKNKIIHDLAKYKVS
ncbi:MAG: LOG family protein [Opitutales bacterium]